MQRRSAASVDAVLQATLQVLVLVGKERLTTTRVAERAGVSVGTLYQYFPNKRALLQACLRRHMDAVSGSLEQVCAEQRTQPLHDMAAALVQAYLAAKFHNEKESMTLYAVSSDVDGAAIAEAASARSHRAVSALFATAREGLRKDPAVVAGVVLSALNGVSRRILETRPREAERAVLRAELLALVHAYLETCIEAPLQD